MSAGEKFAADVNEKIGDSVAREYLGYLIDGISLGEGGAIELKSRHGVEDGA